MYFKCICVVSFVFLTIICCVSLCLPPPPPQRSPSPSWTCADELLEWLWAGSASIKSTHSRCRRLWRTTSNTSDRRTDARTRVQTQKHTPGQTDACLFSWNWASSKKQQLQTEDCSTSAEGVTAAADKQSKRSFCVYDRWSLSILEVFNLLVFIVLSLFCHVVTDCCLSQIHYCSRRRVNDCTEYEIKKKINYNAIQFPALKKCIFMPWVWPGMLRFEELYFSLTAVSHRSCLLENPLLVFIFVFPAAAATAAAATGSVGNTAITPRGGERVNVRCWCLD